MSEDFDEHQDKIERYLGQYITEHKRSIIERVLAERTRFITVVLEDIFKPHNASAVLRTCDCFGVQDIHVIENVNSYKVNPYVTRGASQWVDLHRYHSENGSAVRYCFETLRAKGYTIYGTSPDPQSMSMQDLEPTQKLALVFGNEHNGISEEVKDSCDGLVHIPMRGFTGSFNISVAASIMLVDLIRKAEKYKHKDFYLSEEEKNKIRLDWFRSIVKNSDMHERMFQQKNSEK